MIRLASAAIGMAMLSLLLAACGSAGDNERASATVNPTQRDGGEGGVTVEATWVTAEHAEDGAMKAKLEGYPGDRFVALHLKLDTHSGDLNRYDLVKAASLAADGSASQAASAWVPLSEDSHHREGLLIFPRPEGATGAELALRDIAGVPQRVLRWAPVPEG